MDDKFNNWIVILIIVLLSLWSICSFKCSHDSSGNPKIIIKIDTDY